MGANGRHGLNRDTGYDKTSRSLQTPSNVTRLSRALKRQCKDGRVQIIEYQNGVGTGSTVADAITGGAFGKGIADHIREAYSFICANYEDGDEIVLVGFSRGAFTARSIAGMIGDLGLLTRKGMEFFYPIFKDMQNWRTPQYKDPFPRMPFENKPRGENAEEAYREMLLSVRPCPTRYVFALPSLAHQLTSSLEGAYPSARKRRERAPDQG